MSTQNILPTESLIAGTTRNLLFYLYTQSSKQIDALGMTARFSVTDYVNESDVPLFTKSCTINTPIGEQLAVITAELTRADTLNLSGKYIYQLTINDNGTIAVLKGILDIENNFDKSTI